MSDPSIPELLAALEPAVEPDPGFAATMRARVLRELRGDATTPLSYWSERTDERTDDTEVTLSDEKPDARSSGSEPGSRRRWPVVAAAAVVAALVGAGLLAGTEDGSVDTVPADPSSERSESGQGSDTTATTEALEDDGGATFAGGRLETFDGIEGEFPPYRVAAGDHVWVMALDGTLTKRDRSTFDVLATLTIPESSAIAADGDSLWVADAVDGDVLRIDAATGEVVATVPTGIEVDQDTLRPAGLGWQPGPKRQFARITGIDAEGGSVWVGDLDGRVLRIDPGSNAVVDEIDVRIRPHFVRIDGDHLLVGDFDSDVAVVIDTTTGAEVLSVGTVGDLVGGDLHAGAVYVQGGDGGVVTRADLVTGEEVRSEPLGDPFHNETVSLYAPAPVATEGGVIAASEETFHVLDERSLRTLNSFDLAGDAGEMTIGPDGEAWIVRSYTRTVARLHAVDR